jgi:hypothetical protein
MTTMTDNAAQSPDEDRARSRRRTLDRLYRCLSLIVGGVARDWAHCGKAACRRARCCRGQVCETQICETQVRETQVRETQTRARHPPGASQGRIGPIGFASKQSSGRT